MTGPALGVALGLVGGVGMLLVLDALTRPRMRAPARRRTSRRLLLRGAAFAVLSGVLAVVLTGLPVAGVLAAAVGAAAPRWWHGRAERRRQQERMLAWPDAVDDLRSEVRAGVGLPEAVAALARSGPSALRTTFSGFLAEYRATGSFRDALGSLNRSSDPVADRVVAALTVARDVGGTELGTVLFTLSTLLREDARIRAEILARQSWTVTAGRLAVAAPWLTLAVMCTRPGTVEAYRTPTGAVVLVAVALTSLVAYRLMARAGRLPDDAGGPR